MGLTIATVGQAQLCRAYGVRRLLLANELVDAAAIAWVGTGLAADPDLELVCYVDSIDGVHLLDRHLLEVDPGPSGRRRGCGVFESRDGGVSWSLLSTLDGQPGRDAWNNPANQPPGHLGLPGLLPHPDDPARFWAVIQGFGIFETTDDGATWTPRNRGLRADWPLEDPEVGYCVHKLVMSPLDHDRLYQQNHVGMHRSDDAGHSWVEITDGLPTEFGFAAATHPYDRDSFYVIPLDPGHGRCMPDGKAAVWRTQDAGSSWRRLDRGLPQSGAHLGVLREGMAIDSYDVPGLYFGTSTGQVFASADEGENWDEIASYLPAISSVEVAVLA